MPRRARTELERYADAWESRGVRAWAEGWWEMAVEVGDLLAPLLGVAPGHVSMHQNVSVAAGLFLSCFDYPPERNRIVYTELNFPSLMYLAEGERRRGAEVVVVPSDDGIGVPLERLLAAIDERTRIVPVSHTYFKSAYVQDAAAVARRCREVGAVLLLDVYQSTGVVPLELEAWGVHAAVGGSVKWLCGGPGAGYLWVHPELAPELRPALTGWQADEEPFAFRGGPIHYAGGAWRFLTGTPNVPALHACRAGYEIVAGVGAARHPASLPGAHHAADGGGAGGRIRGAHAARTGAPRRHGVGVAPGGRAVEPRAARAPGAVRLPPRCRGAPVASLLQHRGGVRPRRLRPRHLRRRRRATRTAAQDVRVCSAICIAVDRVMAARHPTARPPCRRLVFWQGVCGTRGTGCHDSGP